MPTTPFAPLPFLKKREVDHHYWILIWLSKTRESGSEFSQHFRSVLGSEYNETFVSIWFVVVLAKLVGFQMAT